jgi:hypothetical protein
VSSPTDTAEYRIVVDPAGKSVIVVELLPVMPQVKWQQPRSVLLDFGYNLSLKGRRDILEK